MGFSFLLAQYRSNWQCAKPAGSVSTVRLTALADTVSVASLDRAAGKSLGLYGCALNNVLVWYACTKLQAALCPCQFVALKDISFFHYLLRQTMSGQGPVPPSLLLLSTVCLHLTCSIFLSQAPSCYIFEVLLMEEY